MNTFKNWVSFHQFIWEAAFEFSVKYYWGLGPSSSDQESLNFIFSAIRPRVGAPGSPGGPMGPQGPQETLGGPQGPWCPPDAWLDPRQIFYGNVNDRLGGNS